MPETVSKGDQSRREILEAAKHLFLTQGYNGTSMRMIAQAAGGRAVAGIYNHFPTKRALFEALIQEYNPYDTLLELMESGQGDTAPDYIRSVMIRVLGFMTGQYEFIGLVQIDLREFEGETISHLLQTVMPRALEMAQRVQSLPGMRPIETIVLLRLFASIVIGFVTTEHVIPTGLFDFWPREVWAEKLTELIIYGVAEEDSR